MKSLSSVLSCGILIAGVVGLIVVVASADSGLELAFAGAGFVGFWLGYNLGILVHGVLLRILSTRAVLIILVGWSKRP